METFQSPYWPYARTAFLANLLFFIALCITTPKETGLGAGFAWIPTFVFVGLPVFLLNIICLALAVVKAVKSRHNPPAQNKKGKLALAMEMTICLFGLGPTVMLATALLGGICSAILSPLIQGT